MVQFDIPEVSIYQVVVRLGLSNAVILLEYITRMGMRYKATEDEFRQPQAMTNQMIPTAAIRYLTSYVRPFTCASYIRARTRMHRRLWSQFNLIAFTLKVLIL